MFLGFIQHYKLCTFHSTRNECCVRRRCCPSPPLPPVLLTKLHNSSVSQLGIVVYWPTGVKVWASPKGGSMYTPFINLVGSNSMSPPWLCTFRKNELERGKTTQSMVHGIPMLSTPCTVYIYHSIPIPYIVYIKHSILMLSKCSPT